MLYYYFKRLGREMNMPFKDYVLANQNKLCKTQLEQGYIQCMLDVLDFNSTAKSDEDFRDMVLTYMYGYVTQKIEVANRGLVNGE